MGSMDSLVGPSGKPQSAQHQSAQHQAILHQSAQQSTQIASTSFPQDLANLKFALDQSAIVAITDTEGVIQYVNDKFCQISKYSREELIGQTHRLVNSGHHPDSFFAQMWQTITGGQVWRGEIKNRAKDGAFYWTDATIVPLFDAQGQPHQYIAIRSDITERKLVEAALRDSERQLRQQTAELETTLKELAQAQMQLVQSEKMSSLGQLVAGVAHEINNPVNFIYGNITPANRYIDDLLSLLGLYETHYPAPHSEITAATEQIDLAFVREDLPKLLHSMQVGAERIQEIVQSLRNFSRMDEAETKLVDIHEGIDSTLLILQNRLKARPEQLAIEVIKSYGNLPMIECYPSQLNQVFMNILMNAIDALEEFNQSRSLQAIRIAPSQISIQTQLVSQARISITIADNGPGIPEIIRDRLFDPFFTTKPVGKGTGLGLSISYQIVTEKHGGTLRCYSTLGSTEFVIELPVNLAQSRP